MTLEYLIEITIKIIISGRLLKIIINIENIINYVLGALTLLSTMALGLTVLYSTTQEQRQERHLLTSLITDLQHQIPKPKTMRS